MADVQINFTGDSGDAQEAAEAINVALAQIEALAELVSKALGDITIPPGRTASVVASARTMEAALSSLERQARSTNREVAGAGSYRPGSLLAAAVTGRVFQPGGGTASGVTQYGSPAGPRNYDELLAGRAIAGVFGPHDNGYAVRYGSGMGGRVVGSLESYSDRGRGGIIGALFGASSGGGGNDRIGRILNGLSPDDGSGGGRGYRGRYPGPDFLRGILPGGARATPAALGALAGAGIGMAPELTAPLIAGIGAIPAYAVTGIAALGTLKLAFSGVGAAIGGNAKEFDDLNKRAQQFVLTVRGLTPFLDKLTATAQGSMFPGLTAGLAAALNPNARANINSTVGLYGSTIGAIGQQAGQFLGSQSTQSMLMQLSKAGAGGLKDLANVVQNLADGFLRLGTAALPLTKWMGDMAVKASQLVDRFVATKQESGSLTSFFVGLEAPMKLLGSLIVDLAKVLGDLVSILSGAGRSAMEGLVALLSGLHSWLEKNHDALANLATVIVNTVIKAIKDLAAVVTPAITVAVNLASALASISTSLGGFPAALAAATVALIAFVKSPVVISLIAIADAVNTIAGAGSGTSTNATGYVGAKWQGAIYSTASGTPLADILQKIASGKKPSSSDIVTLTKGFDLGGLHRFGSVGAAKQAFGGDFSMLTRGTDGSANSRSGIYTQQMVRQLLLDAGAPMDVATNLATISAKGEDSSGNPTTLYNTVGKVPAASADYSIGLFQENFAPGASGHMGQSRVAKYAPMFGLPANMPVAAFVKWLGQHPAAQAKIALDIYGGQGYGAWSSAKGLGITGGGGTPTWTPGTVPVGTGKGSLPINMQIALAQQANAFSAAQGTPGLADDRASAAKYRTVISGAEAYLKHLMPKLDGQDLLDATTEMGSLISTWNSITSTLKTSAKKGRASLGSRLSAQRSGSSVTSSIDMALGPLSGLGIGSLVSNPLDILTATPLSDAHTKWNADLKKWKTEIADFEKQLKDKTISADAVTTITNRITTIKNNVTKALNDIKSAAKTQAANFKDAWSTYIDQVNSDFSQQTQDILANPQKYPGILPISAALADLEDQHTQQQLQQRLQDAQKQLADALAGVGSDTSILDAARQKLGSDALAHALDVAQSYVMGGSAQDMTDRIIKDMQTALAAAQADPTQVAAAQQAVSDAQYNITVDGLQKQASAEQTAYQNSRDELKKHLDAALALWGTYYANSGALASDALTLLNKLLVSFGFTPITDPNSPGSVPTPPNGQPDITTYPTTRALPGQAIPMAAGGIVTSPHYLVDTEGVVRGLIGEAGPEAVVPVGARAMGGSTSGSYNGNGVQVNLHFANGMEWLKDFVQAEVVGNEKPASYRQGIRASQLLREGRVQ